MSEQELREKIKQIRSENQSLASLLEASAIDELEALITQYANEARKEAELHWMRNTSQVLGFVIRAEEGFDKNAYGEAIHWQKQTDKLLAKLEQESKS